MGSLLVEFVCLPLCLLVCLFSFLLTQAEVTWEKEASIGIISIRLPMGRPMEHFLHFLYRLMWEASVYSRCCHPWADGAGLYKQVEQVIGSKPTSSPPPWSLLLFLNSCLAVPQWWTMIIEDKPTKPFLPQVILRLWRHRVISSYHIFRFCI